MKRAAMMLGMLAVAAFAVAQAPQPTNATRRSAGRDSARFSQSSPRPLRR